MQSLRSALEAVWARSDGDEPGFGSGTAVLRSSEGGRSGPGPRFGLLGSPFDEKI